MFVILTLLCLCCVLIYFRGKLMQWCRMIRLANKVPTVSRGLPIIGHIHRLLRNEIELLKFIDETCKEVDELGGVAKIWLGPLPLFMITDLDAAQKLSNVCLKRPYIYKFGSTWMKDGLIVSTPTIWKRHRRMLTPAFNSQVLNGFIEIFNINSKHLVEKLASKAATGMFNSQPYTMNFTLDTICQTVFGINLDTDKVIEKGFREAVERMLFIIMERFRTTWMHVDFLFNRCRMRAIELETVDILHKSTTSVLKNAFSISKIKNNKSEKKSKAFLDLMLVLMDEGSFTEEEVKAELNTMLTAGYDTVASSLIITLALLGSHEKVQDRVYEEIKKVLVAADNDVTKDDLPKLIYLDAVIKESLRLYPVVSLQMRDVDQDVQLTNYILPKGTLTTISLWGINRSKMWGDDVTTFKPERWLETSSLEDENLPFISFGLGKRGCLGKPYAMMLMKILLAHVVRNYRLKSNDETIKVKIAVLLKTVSDCLISIELR